MVSVRFAASRSERRVADGVVHECCTIAAGRSGAESGDNFHEVTMNRRQTLIALALAPFAVRAADAPDAKHVVVYKNESCGCCKLWVDHLNKAGFVTQVNDVDNLGPIKERVGVPYGKGSCHTAEVGGYFVEGHVPASDIQRLLLEKPKARGLTVPGMPAGSPGMEVPSGQVDAYDVLLVKNDGTTTVFSQHGR